MNKLLVFSAVLCCLCLGACDLVEYHPYDTRVSGQRHVNEANVQRIEQAMCGRTSYRFAVISDTQRAYDETADATRSGRMTKPPMPSERSMRGATSIS